jgi:hypothetical protein
MGYGFSAETIESFARSALPQRVHSKLTVDVVAYDRWRPDPDEPELKEGDPYAHPQRRRTWKMSLDAIGWHAIADQYRKFPSPKDDDIFCGMEQPDQPYEEAGISGRIWDGNNLLYFPFVDFAPKARGIGDSSGSDRYSNAFWEELARLYPNRRFYVFDSGNSFHGLLCAVLSLQEKMQWSSFLWRHRERITDEKWITRSNHEDFGGVLRITAGKTRPVPRLKRWVNL